MTTTVRRPPSPALDTARVQFREDQPARATAGHPLVTRDVRELPRAHRTEPVVQTGGSLMQRLGRLLRDHGKPVGAVLLGATAMSSLSGCATAIAYGATPGAPTGARDTDPTLAEFQRKAEALTAKKGSMSYADLAKARDALMTEYAARLGSVPRAQADEDSDGVRAARELLFGSSDRRVDSDGDGLGDAYEIEHGLDPADAQAAGGAKEASWSHGYIPMANNPMIERHVLSAYDAWVKQETGVDPQTRYGEGRSGIDRGRYFLASTLDENNAELTATVDFNGDGVLTPGVKHDFLAPTAGEAKMGRDGKTETTLSVGWWGQCNAVAAAGINFREPKASVTLKLDQPLTIYVVSTTRGTFHAESVTPGPETTDLKLVSGQTVRLPNAEVTSSTKQETKEFELTPDMLKELASNLALRGSKFGTDFVGHRFYAKDAVIELKSGETIRGQLTTPIAKSGQASVRDGSLYVTRLEKDVKMNVYDFASGQTVEKSFKASDIRAVTSEDPRDLEPIEFHTTVLAWLGSEGRAAVMDRDAGPHVWNYSFDKYKYTNTPRADDPKTIDYSMDLYFATNGSYPTNYSYSISYDATGTPLKGEWADSSPNPDFFWRERGGSAGFDHSNGRGNLDHARVMSLLAKSYANEDRGNPN